MMSLIVEAGIPVIRDTCLTDKFLFAIIMSNNIFMKILFVVFYFLFLLVDCQINNKQRRRQVLNGYQFEQTCAKILQSKGYFDIEVTKSSGDQGVDIIASKGLVKYAVQCKYYSSPVGNKAVQEVYAGAKYYDCSNCIVMTNSTFTKSAKELAAKLGVQLWEKCTAVKNHGFLYNLLRVINIFFLCLGILTFLIARHSDFSNAINYTNAVILIIASLFWLLFRANYFCSMLSFLLYLLFALLNVLFTFKNNLKFDSTDVFSFLPAFLSAIYSFSIKKIDPIEVQADDFSALVGTECGSYIQKNISNSVNDDRFKYYNGKFDCMTGKDFEQYCAQLLHEVGFSDITVTPASGDFGVDILGKYNNVLYAFQCKRYSSNVGVDAVYQISGGMKYYHANVGIVLTNQHYTEQAQQLASEIGVVLWDRDFLYDLIDVSISGKDLVSLMFKTKI